MIWVIQNTILSTIIHSCENSLKRLNMDYIDNYFLHRTDFDVPQEESLAALDFLVRPGKVRYIACSTTPPGGALGR